MAYRKGEVILVPFPFTDLSMSKVRPALVVSADAYERATGSIIVAMITSVSHATVYDYELADWKAARLLYPSWVRTKLATLDPSLVRHSIGQLSDSDMKEVEARIKSALKL